MTLLRLHLYCLFLRYLNWLILMFKTPFSFEGRIRRKEYALTLFFVYLISLALGYVAQDGLDGISLLMYLVVFVALGWINLAQSAKRCHDVNTSGWYIGIPFYALYLLFAEGDKKRNRYGISPKYKEYGDDGF